MSRYLSCQLHFTDILLLSCSHILFTFYYGTMIKPKVVLLIFESGKIVLSIAKVLMCSLPRTNTGYEHAMIAWWTMPNGFPGPGAPYLGSSGPGLNSSADLFVFKFLTFIQSGYVTPTGILLCDLPPVEVWCYQAAFRLQTWREMNWNNR